MNKWKYVIGLACLAVGGLIGSQVYLVKHLDRAEDQVVASRNRLTADAYEWTCTEQTLNQQDPWGNPLHVRCARDKHRIRLTVSSDGPDGVPFSRDDITASANRTDWAAALADSIEEVAGATSRGTVKGAIEGVTGRRKK